MLHEQDSGTLATVEEELTEGEELLWVGHPKPARLALRNSSGIVGFGVIVLLFLGVMVLWGRTIGMRMLLGASPVLGVGLLIFLLAIGATLAAPLRNYLRASRTIYAITSRRILIIDGGATRRVTSYGEDDIQRIERHSTDGNSGDIIFRYEPRLHRTPSPGGWQQTSYESEPIGFFGIDHVREVERVLLDTFMVTSGSFQPLKHKHDDLDEDMETFYEEYEDVLADMLPPEDEDSAQQP